MRALEGCRQGARPRMQRQQGVVCHPPERADQLWQAVLGAVALGGTLQRQTFKRSKYVGACVQCRRHTVHRDPHTLPQLPFRSSKRGSRHAAPIHTAQILTLSACSRSCTRLSRSCLQHGQRVENRVVAWVGIMAGL